jgi:signal transduction histidine kinase
VASTVRGGLPGTGLGLPLTKALAEANRASLRIKSAPNAGTLIEVAFPPERVLGPEGR